MTHYPQLSEEQFSAMMREPKWVREARYATGYYDSKFNRIGRYVDYPSYQDRHEITDEQSERACKVYEVLKANELAWAMTPGVLTFVCMGGSYAPTIPDGIGNHRIRAYFHDRDHRVQFIEFHPKWNQHATADESEFYGEWSDIAYENDEQERYHREMTALVNEFGNFLRIPADKRPQQPHQKHGNVHVKAPFNPSNILDYVNRLYGTAYKEFFLSRYFLHHSEDNFVSTF